MISIVQRVNEASVSIEGILHSKIDKGLLILIGVCKGDENEQSYWMAKKIIDLRIFTDVNNKMNLSVKDLGGEILVISQFTLCSDKAKSGNRPGFGTAEDPERANVLYELVIKEMRDYYKSDKIMTGIFSAKMEVKLINDGPVTIILEK